MSATEFLSAAELHQLTGYARVKAQAGWLRAEGIPHQVRGRRLIVSRTHSLAWLEGRQSSAVSLQEPDLSCVH